MNVEDGKGLETINCALYPTAPNGNTPNSLCLTPDGQILMVANANTNNLALFNVAAPGKARPLGFIPVGMYPTSVRYSADRKRIYVANGRGVTPKANPGGPNPLLGAKKKTQKTVREYIAGLYRGTFSVIDMPDEVDMVKYSKDAYRCSPLREDLAVNGPAPKDSPIPAKIGDKSPIKHCIYIIRENRTYDQVLGDMKEGNGDPKLCLFPEKITPNAHHLARQFVLLDNFYCDGEVSAEGHEWSMGAYCTDFVRRVWPLTYRAGAGKKFDLYPAEAHFDELARPAGGYIWDRCAEAKVSYRSYGEWIENGKTLKDPGKPRVKALEGQHYDPWYVGFGLDYKDELRADRFISELHRFEKEGGMPQLSIVKLPNDHTQGQKVGKPTPTAMVAENDLALGRIVEAITKSKFWPETAIFVIEDDAQNGSDHVDAHRTVSLHRHERKQPPFRRVVQRAAVLAGFERLGELDAAFVAFVDQLAEALRSTAQPFLDLQLQPRLPLDRRLRHLVELSLIERQPFVELRRMAIEHRHDVVEHRPNVDRHCRRERIRFLELVRQVGDDRIPVEMPNLRSHGRHRHHVRGVLHELADVAVIGMIVVRPMRQDQVGLELADEADDRRPVLQRREQAAVGDVERHVFGADDLAGRGRLGAALLDELRSRIDVMAGAAVGDADHLDDMAAASPECGAAAGTVIRIVRMGAEDQDPQLRHSANSSVTPVRRSYASRYFSRVRRTTSAGNGGGGLFLSQPDASSQSRTNCLSYDGGLEPGRYESAGQNRELSGVSTSSMRMSSPVGRWPHSNFVSASRMPRRPACSAARR